MRPICYHGPTDSGVDVRRHPRWLRLWAWAARESDGRQPGRRSAPCPRSTSIRGGPHMQASCPPRHLAGLSYRDREARWEQILTADRPAESNFVAETVAGDVVGFAGGGPEREGNPTYRATLTRALRHIPTRSVPAQGPGAPPRLRCGPPAAGRWVRLDVGVGAEGQPPRLPVLRDARRRASWPEDDRSQRGAPRRGVLRLEGHCEPGSRGCGSNMNTKRC